MALATTLHLVRPLELARLRAHPTWINRFRPSSGGTFMTYYVTCLNYFATGDAWPPGSREEPLGGMLFGLATVPCPTLENGSFGVVEPRQVRWILDAIVRLDLAAIRRAVEGADADELADEEVDDYELLLEDDEPAPDVIEDELLGLARFYGRAARKRRGIVMYTT